MAGCLPLCYVNILRSMQNGANGELAVPMYALTYVKPIKRRIQTLFSYQKHLLGNPFRRLFLPVFIRCRHGRVAQKYIKSIAKSAKTSFDNEILHSKRHFRIPKAALPHPQSGTFAFPKRHFRNAILTVWLACFCVIRVDVLFFV